MGNLNEVKELLEQLEGQYSPAKSLQSDTLFQEMLKEEVELFRQQNQNFPGKVLFGIAESGEVIYEGITTHLPKEFAGMFIILNPEIKKEPIKESEEDLEKKKQQRIMEEKEQMELKIKIQLSEQLELKKQTLIDRILKEM